LANTTPHFLQSARSSWTNPHLGQFTIPAPGVQSYFLPILSPLQSAGSPYFFTIKTVVLTPQDSHDGLGVRDLARLNHVQALGKRVALHGDVLPLFEVLGDLGQPGGQEEVNNFIADSR
jgi:hypothetical protein